MYVWFEWGWVLTSLLALLVASFFDIKDRLIPDTIWMVQLLFAIIFDIGWILSKPGLVDAVIFISNIVFAAIIIVASIFLGAMAGGDLKAIGVLSLSYPQLVYLRDPPLSQLEIFPPLFSILLNFWVCYLLLALIFVLYNSFQLFSNSLFEDTTGSFLTKILILFEGIRVSRKFLETRKHYNVAEKLVDGEWVLHTPRFEKQLTDDEYEKIEQEAKEEALVNMRETDKTFIWIRPHIPGIPFFLLGFLITLFFGSLISLGF